QQILRTGTIVFHFYRYWWQGIEVDAVELAALLATFPADDPGRAFSAADCTVILLESSFAGRNPIEIERSAAQRKSLFASRSLWDSLLALAAANADGLTYSGYSFDRRADLYRVDLAPEQSSRLVRDAVRLAPRNLRPMIESLGTPSSVVFSCSRRV